MPKMRQLAPRVEENIHQKRASSKTSAFINERLETSEQKTHKISAVQNFISPQTFLCCNSAKQIGVSMLRSHQSPHSSEGANRGDKPSIGRRLHFRHSQTKSRRRCRLHARSVENGAKIDEHRRKISIVAPAGGRRALSGGRFAIVFRMRRRCAASRRAGRARTIKIIRRGRELRFSHAPPRSSIAGRAAKTGARFCSASTPTGANVSCAL